MERLMVRIYLVLAGLFAALASPAVAAPKVAVMPFEIRDAEIQGDPFAMPKEDDLARLKIVAEELKSLMQKSGRYDVIDLSAYAADIEKASPFYKCNGCEVDVAKKIGADVVVTGFVDKVSDALMSLQVFERNAASGELQKAGSAEIRGNTDELWLHGIRYLWKNRLNAKAETQE